MSEVPAEEDRRWEDGSPQRELIDRVLGGASVREVSRLALHRQGRGILEGFAMSVASNFHVRALANGNALPSDGDKQCSLLDTIVTGSRASIARAAAIDPSSVSDVLAEVAQWSSAVVANQASCASVYGARCAIDGDIIDVFTELPLEPTPIQQASMNAARWVMLGTGMRGGRITRIERLMALHMSGNVYAMRLDHDVPCGLPLAQIAKRYRQWYNDSRLVHDSPSLANQLVCQLLGIDTTVRGLRLVLASQRNQSAVQKLIADELELFNSTRKTDSRPRRAGKRTQALTREPLAASTEQSQTPKSMGYVVEGLAVLAGLTDAQTTMLQSFMGGDYVANSSARASIYTRLMRYVGAFDGCMANSRPDVVNTSDYKVAYAIFTAAFGGSHPELRALEEVINTLGEGRSARRARELLEELSRAILTFSMSLARCDTAKLAALVTESRARRNASSDTKV